MGSYLGDVGISANGSLKTFKITPPVPREISFEANPVALPTVQDTTGASITITENDLPVINPYVPCKYVAIVIVSGRNLSGASVTVNSQAYLNGTSAAAPHVQTGVINNNYWTHSVMRFPDVQVGSVLDIRLWASLLGVNLLHCGLMVFASQIEICKPGTILRDLTLADWINPAFVGGITPTAGATGSWVLYPSVSNILSFATNGSNLSFPAMVLQSQFKLGRVPNGDQTLNTLITSDPTRYPYQYMRNNMFTTFSFREMLR